MASEQDDTVFPEEDQEEDDDEFQEDEEEEDVDVLEEPEDDEEDEASPSTSTALAAAVTVAVPGSAISNGYNAPISTATATTIVVATSSDSKLQRMEQIEEKKPLDESRKLFQRLWTDEDEIGLLQGFLDYTAQRGSSHHNDTALFYDQIKSKLQLDFNKNQLVEKLRRLKKKYRNVLSKIDSGKEFSFKSSHDQATFEISRKIWSNAGQIGGAPEDNAMDDDEINLNPNPNPSPNFSHSLSSKNEVIMGNSAEKRTPPSRKRSRSLSRPGMRTDVKRELNDEDNNFISNTNNNNNSHNSSHSIQGLIEETVRSCLSPLLKELLSNATAIATAMPMGMGSPLPFGFGFSFGARGFGGLALNPMTLGLNLGSGEVVDDKWRKQQILELEVYSKRLELVQDQIKVALQELRSAGG